MIKCTGPDSACFLHSKSFNSGSKYLLWFAFAVGCADVWFTEWGSSCYRNEGLCSGFSSNVQWQWCLDTAVVHPFHHWKVSSLVEGFSICQFWVAWLTLSSALNPSGCQVNQTWLKHLQLKHLDSSALFCYLPPIQWSHRADFMHGLVGLLGLIFWGPWNICTNMS